MTTHVTAPTEHITVNGDRIAYRRFGAATGTPVLLLQHFRGGLDNWDPLLTDGLAADRPVILLDSVGVSGSAGEVPVTFEGMADFAADFLRTLGLALVDVVGFSIGGAVAQALTFRHPELVRRLVLLGTIPPAGDMSEAETKVLDVVMHPDLTLDDYLYLFFGRSDAAKQAGRDFWQRRHQRTTDYDPEATTAVGERQQQAVVSWAQWPEADRDTALQAITQPTLIVNGDRDIMLPTVNSHILAKHIPNSQLIIYPDSGHASQFQYPKVFLANLRQFLDAEVVFS
ncbi:alpha/beta fold hydrolase [Amycolatopsis sp. CA-161197]|uniref:alpha/beta fold hydrolase n=1 Tax=unclassified Amycolatopsis TaxID=2618356 RepID=UPI0034520CAA